MYTHTHTHTHKHTHAHTHTCKHTHECTYICTYIYWEKLKSKVIHEWWIYYKGKLTLKCLGFHEPSPGHKDVETRVDRTMIDV